jgi:hypothetical protein
LAKTCEGAQSRSFPLQKLIPYDLLRPAYLALRD